MRYEYRGLASLGGHGHMVWELVFDMHVQYIYTLCQEKNILCRNRTREGTRHGDAKIAKAFMEMVVLVINMYQASHVSQVPCTHVATYNLHNRLPSTFLPAKTTTSRASKKSNALMTSQNSVHAIVRHVDSTVLSATFVRRFSLHTGEKSVSGYEYLTGSRSSKRQYQQL
jgi:hypothetical protein